MPEYAGSALHVNWIYSGGTVTVTGNQRTFSTTPSVALYRKTAGADTDETYIPGIKDRQISIGYVDQADGTALYTALREGTEGTLVVGPEGTAADKPRETYPAISMGPTRNEPFDNVVEITCNFQGNGAVTYNNY